MSKRHDSSLSYFAAGLAEQLAGAVRQRYTLMPGRFSLSTQLLSSPLIRWVQSIDERFYGWLELLPSLRTSSLLPHLFSRTWEEAEAAPFTFSWFNRDWLRYLYSRGLYLPGESSTAWIPQENVTLPGTPFADIPGFSLPTVQEGPGIYPLPGISPALALAAGIVRQIHERHPAGIRQHNTGPFPVRLPPSSPAMVEQVMALPAIFNTEPAIEDVMQETGSDKGATLPVFSAAAVETSLGEAIFNKYISMQPGMILPQEITTTGLGLPQHILNINLQQDMPEAQEAYPAQQETYFTEGRELPHVFQPRLPQSPPPMSAGASARQSEAAWPPPAEEELPFMPGVYERSVLPTKDRVSGDRAGHRRPPAGGESWHETDINFDFGPDPDLSAPAALPSVIREGGLSFSIAQALLASEDSAGTAAPVLPHAPAAFVQMKPSAPAEQQADEQAEAQTSAEDRQEDTPGAAPDMEAMAQEVYDILRRRMLIEMERLHGSAR